MDLNLIIERCKNSDMDAFNALFDMYGARAVRTAYLITGRRELSEEIAQEAFIQCYKEIRKLKETATFNSWFFRMLTRISWRYCTKEKAYVPIDSLEENSRSLTSAGDNVNEKIEGHEIRILVDKALRGLSVSLRTTVILFYFNELSVKEISKAMGCFEGTVKSRLHSARKLLSKELQGKEFEGYRLNGRTGGRECNIDAKPRTI